MASAPEISFYEKTENAKKIKSDGKGGTYETFEPITRVYISHYSKVDGVVNDFHKIASADEIAAHPVQYQAFLDKKAHGSYEDFVKSKEKELKAEFEAKKAPKAEPIKEIKPAVKPLVPSAKVGV